MYFKDQVVIDDGVAYILVELEHHLPPCLSARLQRCSYFQQATLILGMKIYKLN
jgi:hypothetical protein